MSLPVHSHPHEYHPGTSSTWCTALFPGRSHEKPARVTPAGVSWPGTCTASSTMVPASSSPLLQQPDPPPLGATRTDAEVTVSIAVPIMTGTSSTPCTCLFLGRAMRHQPDRTPDAPRPRGCSAFDVGARVDLRVSGSWRCRKLIEPTRRLPQEARAEVGVAVQSWSVGTRRTCQEARGTDDAIAGGSTLLGVLRCDAPRQPPRPDHRRKNPVEGPAHRPGNPRR